jgi:hypothetical protein
VVKVFVSLVSKSGDALLLGNTVKVLAWKMKSDSTRDVTTHTSHGWKKSYVKAHSLVVGSK